MRLISKYMVALIVAATAIAFGIRNFHHSAQNTIRPASQAHDVNSQPEHETVLLRAETRPATSGSIVRLHWDAAAKPVRRAPYGILYIYDGGMPNKLLLDRRVLDSGSTDYMAETGEITFHLVLPGGRPEGESLLVLLRAREEMRGGVRPGGSSKDYQSDKPATGEHLGR